MTEPLLNLVPVTHPSEPAPPAPEPASAKPSAQQPPDTSRAAPAPKRRSPTTRRSSATAAPARAETPHTETPGPWREWSSFDRTVSYRLPAELVDELAERLWSLRIQATGVTVAAALTQLLDLSDDELRALVDRADAAKPRRRATGR